MEIKLTLTVEEVNILLNLIGQTPTSSGLFPLAVNIKGQAEAQVPKQEEEQKPE
jgi:hypothetical protein